MPVSKEAQAIAGKDPLAPRFVFGKLGGRILIWKRLLEVTQMTLDQVINRLSCSELERLKECAVHGMYDELLQLLRAYGYDESDTPTSIGQKVKRLIR